MKKIVVVVFSTFMGTFSYGQWEVIESGVSNHLLGVHALSPSEIFVCGSSGIMLHSADEGVNWVVQTSNTTEDLYSVYFVNLTLGFAVGNDGVFLKTMDGGENWVESSISDEHLRHVIFLNENIGFIGANHGKILKTTDGGNLWTTIDVGIPLGIYDIIFSDLNHGCAIGFYGEICVTMDGGDTWQVTTDVSDYQMGVFCALTPAITFVVGDNGILMKSEADYSNWAPVQTQSSNFYSGIDFLDPLTGYIVGGDVQSNTGYILSSMDGGATWTESLSGTPRLFRIDFTPDKTCGYIVGLNGTILGMCLENNAIEEEADMANELQVFPRPAARYITVKPKESDFNLWVGYTIYDSKGSEKMRSEFSGKSELTIDINDFPCGDYIIVVVEKNGRKTSTTFTKI